MSAAIMVATYIGNLYSPLCNSIARENAFTNVYLLVELEMFASRFNSPLFLYTVMISPHNTIPSNQILPRSSSHQIVIHYITVRIG